MENNELQTLFFAELSDAYDAEKQVLKALPLLIQEASDESLRTSLENHLQETEDQIQRLEEIATLLDMTLASKTCAGMAGILEEGKKMLATGGSSELMDVLITISAAKVEHYEMSTYTSLVTLADTLGYDEVQDLLAESLDEETTAAEIVESAASGGIFSAGLAEKASAESDQ